VLAADRSPLDGATAHCWSADRSPRGADL